MVGSDASEIGWAVKSRLIPFGCPVVPLEYCSRSPSHSSSTGVTGRLATASA
nr:hypothetical protein [uncultured Modestobacter sp.]